MRTDIISQSFTTSNGTFNSSGAAGNVHGHIDRVSFKNTSWGNGSVVITDSGDQSITFTTVSGTLTRTFYPRLFAHNGVTALSGTNASELVKPLMMGPLIFSGIGMGSVAGGNTGRVDVYFNPL